jgi:L-fuculose-phosphate aldolase
MQTHPSPESVLRAQLLSATQHLDAIGLNRGTSGNVSLRCGAGMLITPSGVAPASLTCDAMVFLGNDGSDASGAVRPSSEWRMHRDILAARAEFNAVVHTHSTYAVTLATLRREIPAFHYMVAVAGGHNVRCSGYALFGTEQLSSLALAALVDRKACLLANHGLIAAGRDLAEAMAIAVEVEALAEQYCHALQIGEPVLLSDHEMAAVLRQFSGYGRWNGHNESAP